jgi:hypothetical protein
MKAQLECGFGYPVELKWHWSDRVVMNWRWYALSMCHQASANKMLHAATINASAADSSTSARPLLGE